MWKEARQGEERRVRARAGYAPVTHDRHDRQMPQRSDQHHSPRTITLRAGTNTHAGVTTARIVKWVERAEQASKPTLSRPFGGHVPGRVAIREGHVVSKGRGCEPVGRHGRGSSCSTTKEQAVTGVEGTWGTRGTEEDHDCSDRTA